MDVARLDRARLVAVWRAVRPLLSSAEAREFMAAVRERGSMPDAWTCAELLRPADPVPMYRAILAAVSDWLRARTSNELLPVCNGCEACGFDGGTRHPSLLESAANVGPVELAWCFLALLDEVEKHVGHTGDGNVFDAVDAIRDLATLADERFVSRVEPLLDPLERAADEALEPDSPAFSEWVGHATLLVLSCAQTLLESVTRKPAFADGRGCGSPSLHLSYAERLAPPSDGQLLVVRDLFADALVTIPSPTTRSAA
jgi:hypothetical protein